MRSEPLYSVDSSRQVPARKVVRLDARIKVVTYKPDPIPVTYFGDHPACRLLINCFWLGVSTSAVRHSNPGKFMLNSSDSIYLLRSSLLVFRPSVQNER